MEDYQLLIDLHKEAKRQGPGGEAETKKAVELAMLDPSTPLKIADIGCGTGASAIQLARLLNAEITAVDFLPDFLEVLETHAKHMGVSEKITTLACSMDDLPFANEEYDVIWSEGAIYNIGFEKGINLWRRFLKPDGMLVVSEITWTTGSRPSEIETYWNTEYPEINTASSKISLLEKSGYSPVAYFVLPEHCWLENYYRPIQDRVEDFLNRNDNREEARGIVEWEAREIELYEKYKAHYSYGVYVARKLGNQTTVDPK